MNIFERIQHDTGLENYCTDILVGILQKNPILLRDFCIDVLGIPEDSFPESLKISPQLHYKGVNVDEKKSFVDIVISGINFLCFLEMKVESSENEGQLIKYDSVLQKLKKENNINLNVFLRFCTKYSEKVNFKEDGYFKKLRWYHIHNFLRIYCQDNTLIKEFSQFLEMNMMSDKELIYNKNEALSFYENLEIFNDVLKNLKSSLSDFDLGIIKNCFDIKTSPSLYFKHKRYGYAFKPYHDEKSSEYWTGIFIGFEFTDDGILCKLDFWSKSNNSKIKGFGFKSNNKEDDIDTIRDKYNPNIGILSYKKLKKSGTKISDIEKWFIEELQNIQEN